MTMIKLFCLFVILCVPEGVYQNPEFKISIHLDGVEEGREAVETPDAVPNVGSGWLGKLDMSI